MDAISKILLAIIALGIVAIFAAIPVFILWNMIDPSDFGLPEISFYQSMGITLLCSILFKNYVTTK
jgi:hypothetical protein